MKKKTVAGGAVIALIVLVVGTWQAYEIGYRRGMRETLFRFLYFTGKESGSAYLGPQQTPLEQEAERRVYSQVHDQMQRVVIRILQETGKPQVTPDDIIPLTK